MANFRSGCDHTKTVKVSDFFIDKKPNDINVSQFSCNHQDIGLNIIAHEMGHAVNNFFIDNPKVSDDSLKKFNSMRNCTKSFYRHPLRNVGKNAYDKFDYDSLRVEEDMADQIGALIAVNPGMRMCMALGLDGEKYTNLEFQNKDTDNTHSTSFTRLLIEASYRPGGIPSECSEAMAEASHYFNFEMCIK